LALHREEIACVIPDALPTSNYNFDTHKEYGREHGQLEGTMEVGGAMPCAAPRLCMYWNISAIL
jgi:hypothetical protein